MWLQYFFYSRFLMCLNENCDCLIFKMTDTADRYLKILLTILLQYRTLLYDMWPIKLLYLFVQKLKLTSNIPKYGCHCQSANPRYRNYITWLPHSLLGIFTHFSCISLITPPPSIVTLEICMCVCIYVKLCMHILHSRHYWYL